MWSPTQNDTFEAQFTYLWLCNHHSRGQKDGHIYVPINSQQYSCINKARSMAAVDDMPVGIQELSQGPTPR